MKMPAADTEEMVEMTRSDNPDDWPRLHVEKKVLLDETSVKSAELVQSAFDKQWRLSVKLTDEGALKFADVTGRNVGNRLAIVIDGGLCMAPQLRERISGGAFEVSGVFTKEALDELARKINDAAKGKGRRK